MRMPSHAVVLCALLGLACDRSPVGQSTERVGGPRLRPSFDVQPGGLPEDTACAEGQAYSLNGEHIGRDDSLLVEFRAPSGAPRPRCGGIPFTEALSGSARLVLRFRVIRWDLPPGLHQYDYRFWVRQLRDADEFRFDTSVAGPYLDSSLIVKRDTVAAPAPDGYDLSCTSCISGTFLRLCRRPVKGVAMRRSRCGPTSIPPST